MRVYNPTGRRTPCHVVAIDRGESVAKFFVSYETVMGVCGELDGKFFRARRHNHWGPTTGRHVNEMGIRDWPELPDDEFDELVHKLEAAPVIQVLREGDWDE